MMIRNKSDKTCFLQVGKYRSFRFSPGDIGDIGDVAISADTKDSIIHNIVFGKEYTCISICSVEFYDYFERVREEEPIGSRFEILDL